MKTKDTILEDSIPVVTCYECGCEIEDDMQILIDGHQYCEGCVEELFTCCERCGEIVRRDNISISDDGDHYCGDCYSELYTCCDECDCEIGRDDVYYCEQTDRYLCEECYNESRLVHSHEYKPKLVFFGTGRLYFGVELEVENMSNRDNGDVAKELQEKHELVYCKSDGSLETGFEVVTHPFSYERYKMDIAKKFNDILDYLTQAGYRSYNTGTCGIHIHLTKTAFGSIHLYKWLKFFYENPDFIATISQRKRSDLDRWASLTEDQNETLIYKAIKKTGDHNQRYVAVNLANAQTIEIRIFRGTLNQKSFHKNIEFLMSLYDYTTEESLPNISVARFIQYVITHKSTYKNLYEFLTIKRLVLNAEGANNVHSDIQTEG